MFEAGEGSDGPNNVILVLTASPLHYPQNVLVPFFVPFVIIEK